MKSWTKQLYLPILKSNFKRSNIDFKMFDINYCVPSSLLGLETHVTFLRAGKSPHEPHTHIDEELIIVLSGKLQILKLSQNHILTPETPHFGMENTPNGIPMNH